MINFKEFLMPLIDKLLIPLIPLITLIVGWISRGVYDRKKRGIEISDLARGLKAEILDIKNELIKKADEYKSIDNYQSAFRSYLANVAKGIKAEPDYIKKHKDILLTNISENLYVIYNSNVNKLGLFDEKLIIEVKRYYERTRRWNEKHHMLKNTLEPFNLVNEKTNVLLDECKSFVNELVSEADNLAVELEKKIKRY